mgnify:CR=1 FL=1
MDRENGESKAATVRTGAAVEAVILRDVKEQKRKAERNQAARDLVDSKKTSKKPNSQLERWDLAEYIEVAAHLNVINPETATEARLTQLFRNLIHPGRTIRLGQTCDRGTALTAVAAV